MFNYLCLVFFFFDLDKEAEYLLHKNTFIGVALWVRTLTMNYNVTGLSLVADLSPPSFPVISLLSVIT